MKEKAQKNIAKRFTSKIKNFPKFAKYYFIFGLVVKVFIVAGGLGVWGFLGLVPHNGEIAKISSIHAYVAKNNQIAGKKLASEGLSIGDVAGVYIYEEDQLNDCDQNVVDKQ